MPRTTEAHGADVLERVRSHLPSLTTSSQRVAEAILASPTKVISLSASQLAAASASSVGTVVRFCHAIGFSGYQDFKDRLVETTAATHTFGMTPRRRNRSGTTDTVLTNTLVGLARSADTIDNHLVSRAAEVLRGARRVLIPSAGPSQPLAMAFGQMLSCAGCAASYPTDPQTQLAVAEQLGASDVGFVISHSGTTEQTLQAAHAARDSGAEIVALTSYATSPLARLADVTIVAGSPSDEYRTEDRASRPVHLAVLQALFAVIEHGAGREELGRNPSEIRRP